MMNITLDSTIRDLYQHPLGRDLLNKLFLQMGRDVRLITNPLTGSLRLRTMKKLTEGIVGEDFFDTFLQLVNSESDLPFAGEAAAEAQWWKEAVFYQIYPSSFKDSNGDGIGDINGIIEKLDVLKDLGVDAIWLNPVYDSPWDDNGYDIRNYRAIAQRFGSLADMDRLIQEVHARNMKIIMDLVVNHTSDEHPWFVEALTDPTSPKRDYYFFREGHDGGPPNNWKSFFSGSAWKKVVAKTDGSDDPDESDASDASDGTYVLHLFSQKQMDLNWDNPKVRQEVQSIVEWWMIRGIDGFRLDVINYISKREGLPMGNPFIGDLMQFTGIEHYFYGPNLHKYLRELNEQAFKPYGGFSVGETPGIGTEGGKLLSQAHRRELDLIFNFDHLETPGHVRFDQYVYDLNYLKTYHLDRQKQLTGQDWVSLFTDNHDNPRMISKIDPAGTYRTELSKLLLTMLLMLKGTPFIFQGQEIGRTNRKFTSLDELRDVESFNKYRELIAQGRTEGEAFAQVLAGTRDHARTVMAWDGTPNGGFTEGTPWIDQAPDYAMVNVQRDMADQTSVWNWTRQLIELRRENSTLVYGEVIFHSETVNNWFAWERSDAEGSFYVEMNLSNQPMKRPLLLPQRFISLSSVPQPDLRTFGPYEVRLSKLK